MEGRFNKGAVKTNNVKKLYHAFIRDSLKAILTTHITACIKKNGPDDDSLTDKLTKGNSKSPEEIEAILLEYARKLLSLEDTEMVCRDISKLATREIEEVVRENVGEYNHITDLTAFLLSHISITEGTKLVRGSSFLHDMAMGQIRHNPMIQDVLQRIDRRLEEEFHLDFEEIIRRYRSPYHPYDHGICAAELYFFIWGLDSEVALQLSDSSDPFAHSMNSLFWVVEPDKARQKLMENYLWITERTGFAILAHNLYPRYFKETGIEEGAGDGQGPMWHINLEKDPFAYFCMLMDSLQAWGRDKYYDEALTVEPLFYADQYDISIRNDRLVITVYSYTQRFGEIKDRFIDGLDSFLDHCSSYLSIEMVPKV